MANSKWEVGNPIFEADQTCPMNKVWPWNGHRLFAYDLIRFLKPKLYVELGTYWGNSFFAFCQGVKDDGLSTECVAVDTWEGDEQTGPYNQDVYETVQTIVTNKFPSVDVKLIRSLFSEAVGSFEDETIDLLHIDGLHTYEAVREDYLTWLPKVAQNGIVLFHDIADDCDYGSVKYWKELVAKYPSYTFQHSWGLGILFPKGQYYYEKMVENNFNDKLKLYEFASELALTRTQKQSSDDRGERQDALIKYLEKQRDELGSRVNELENQRNSLEQSTSWKTIQILRTLFGRNKS